MKLSDLYGYYPHEEELLWQFVGEHDYNNVDFPVFSILVLWGNPTINKQYKSAEKWQRKLVSDYRKDPNLANTILVVDTGQKMVIDDYHRIMALVKNKVRAIRALVIGVNHG